MHVFRCTFLIAASLLSLTASLPAQSAADPSGHWEGAISLPAGDLPIELDLAKNAKGQYFGTVSQPTQKLKGFPISTITIKDNAIALELVGGSLGGVVKNDGKSISGEFAPSGRIETVPFSLTRNGDAQIEAPPKNAPISKNLEGVWKGTLAVDGGEFPIVLKMSNQQDGTSTAVMNSVNEGFELPAAMVQKGASLTLEVKILSSSYSGTLNAAGTELAGTYTTQGMSLPLTFHRDSGK
jgi:hypothetical protein